MMQQSKRWTSDVIALIVLLGVGASLGGCGDEETGMPLRLSGPSTAQDGDTIWVDVTMGQVMREDVADAQFQLHYTTAHLEGLRYELGAAVRRSEASVEHYPSKASFDFGVPLADAVDDESERLVRVQFRVRETAPRGVASHLRLANQELYRRDGSMRRFEEGASMRMAIQSVSEADQMQEAHLDIGDQYTIKDTITVGEVVAPDSARILIRAAQSNGAERVVAQKDVSSGRHQNVKIELDPEFGLSEKKFAFLEAGLYQIADATGERGRRFRREGRPLQTTFTAHYRTSRPESEIIVRNKPLTDHTLVVDSVLATEPADLVIHRNRHGGPLIPGIIGKARVGTGVNQNVEVEIFEDETVVCGETLWPMLHVRSESEDQPYEIDYPIITEPVIIECG